MSVEDVLAETQVGGVAVCGRSRCSWGLTGGVQAASEVGGGGSSVTRGSLVCWRRRYGWRTGWLMIRQWKACDARCDEEATLAATRRFVAVGVV